MVSLQRLALEETSEIAKLMIDQLIGDLQILRAKAERFLVSIADSGLGEWTRWLVGTIQTWFDALNGLSAKTISKLVTIGALLTAGPIALWMGAAAINRIRNTWDAMRAGGSSAGANAAALTRAGGLGGGSELVSAAVMLKSAARELSMAARRFGGRGSGGARAGGKYYGAAGGGYPGDPMRVDYRYPKTDYLDKAKTTNDASLAAASTRMVAARKRLLTTEKQLNATRLQGEKIAHRVEAREISIAKLARKAATSKKSSFAAAENLALAQKRLVTDQREQVQVLSRLEKQTRAASSATKEFRSSVGSMGATTRTANADLAKAVRNQAMMNDARFRAAHAMRDSRMPGTYAGSVQRSMSFDNTFKNWDKPVSNAGKAAAIAARSFAHLKGAFVAVAASLFGPLGILIGLSILAGLIGKKVIENGLRAQKIAALEYKDAIVELAAAQKRLAAEEEAAERGVTGSGYTMGGIKAEIALIEKRKAEVFRQDEVAEGEHYDKLVAGITGAVNDLKSAKIGFAQYTSDLGTIIAESKDFLDESAIIDKQAIKNLIERATKLKDVADKQLTPYSNVLNGIGRELGTLEEGMLAGKVSLQGGQAVLSDAKRQLDELAGAMDPATLELFAGWIDVVNGRILTLTDSAKDLKNEIDVGALNAFASQLATLQEQLAKEWEKPAELEFLGKSAKASLADWGHSFKIQGQFELDRADLDLQDDQKKKLEDQFVSLGKDIGRKFANAITNSSVQNLIVEFKDALMAVAVQRVFTKAGEKFGKTLSESFIGEFAASAKGPLLVAYAAIIVGAIIHGNKKYKEAMAAQEADREIYIAQVNEVAGLYAQLTDTNKALVDAAGGVAERIELATSLLAEQNRAISEVMRMAQELWTTPGLPDDQLEVFFQRVRDFGGPADIDPAELEHLTRLFEGLIGIAHRNEEAMAKEAVEVEGLRTEFERLGEAALTSENALAELQEFIDNHLNLSITAAAAGVFALYEYFEELAQLRESLSFIGDLSSAISGLLPDTDMEKFLKTGDISDTLIGQLMAAGGDADSMRLLGVRIQALRDFEGLVEGWRDSGEVSGELVETIKELTGSDFSHMIEQIQDVGEELEGNLKLIEDLKRGLEEFIPGRTEESWVLSDLLRTGQLSEGLMRQLKEAGAPSELLSEFARSRSLLYDFYQNAERWRNEFHFEREEYKLQMAVEEAAFNLHSALSTTTDDLDASLEENNRLLEEAIQAAHDSLTGGVEQAAAAFHAELETLADSLAVEISSLEQSIRDLIEALGNLQFGQKDPDNPTAINPSTGHVIGPSGGGKFKDGVETGVNPIGPNGETAVQATLRCQASGWDGAAWDGPSKSYVCYNIAEGAKLKPGRPRPEPLPPPPPEPLPTTPIVSPAYLAMDSSCILQGGTPEWSGGAIGVGNFRCIPAPKPPPVDTSVAVPGLPGLGLVTGTVDPGSIIPAVSPAYLAMDQNCVLQGGTPQWSGGSMGVGNFRCIPAPAPLKPVPPKPVLPRPVPPRPVSPAYQAMENNCILHGGTPQWSGGSTGVGNFRCIPAPKPKPPLRPPEPPLIVPPIW